MNANQLAKYVMENYDAITGWTPEGMDEEEPFNENVWELVSEHRIVPTHFVESWYRLREIYAVTA